MENEASVNNGVARMVLSVIVIAIEVIFIILLLTKLSGRSDYRAFRRGAGEPDRLRAEFPGHPFGSAAEGAQLGGKLV
ncbi:MAG: hypothetical protein II008_10195 [Oscillospiraceae bacterium]|nr:hypothetical protein [Oscillospiraceae bacterium]